MPAILSKDLAANILGRDWSFGYNCYEVGHTWTPSCTGAALEVSSAAAIKIMPLYALLYAFSQLAVQQRFDLDSSWDTAKSTLRSTFFIFFHAYNGSILGCALRNAFGRFYYRVLVCAPALLSSYISLLIEKPNRRQALAFYLLNMASEILYRMAVTKGYFRPLRYGDTLLFALSLGAWYHLLKTHGFGHDPISAAVKVLIGRDEAKSRSRKHHAKWPQVEDSSTSYAQVQGDQEKSLLAIEEDPKRAFNTDQEEQQQQTIARTQARSRKQSAILEQMEKCTNYLSQLLDRLGEQLFDGRHASCPHEQERTCLRYVLAPIPTRFLVGHTIQSLLRVSSKPYALMLHPRRTLMEAFTSSASARFGLFLACLVSSGRLTSCCLRRYSNSNEPAWHALVAGCVAGSSMLWSPKASLSMYVMWKAVEQYYLLAARQGRVRHFNFTISTIYSVSAATILYTFALEPRFVRPSYMKFLDRLSDHRLHQLNRMVLDVFGTGSSVGYEDYFPDLDPKFMSNQFKELIFNWMIQPYE